MQETLLRAQERQGGEQEGKKSARSLEAKHAEK
jgi:hypothetical protein